jgi:hypothetical protein
MSVLNDSVSTIDDGTAPHSSKFLEYCAKLYETTIHLFGRNLASLYEKEHIELADALPENTNVTYIELLNTDNYTKSSTEAMTKHLRTSKRLQRIYWHGEMREREGIICCFLQAFQESTSLKILPWYTLNSLSLMAGHPTWRSKTCWRIPRP